MTTPNPQHGFFLLIPAFIADDPDIDDATAMLYGRIVALSNQKGYCWASDQYLAELTRVTEREVKNRLKVLQEKGYIERESKKEGFTWTRKIYPLQGFKKEVTKGTSVPFEREQVFPSKGNRCSLEYNKPNTISIEKDKTTTTKPPPPKKTADPNCPIGGGGCITTSLIYRNTKGEATCVSDSDIFAYFLKLPYTTEEIQQAIEEVKKSTDFIGNIFKYLEAICLRIHNTKSFKIKEMPKKEECDIPDVSHKPTVNLGELIKKKALEKKNEAKQISSE